MAGVAMGATRLGPSRGALCRPGRAHLRWAVSLYPLHHSRGATEPLSADCPVLPAHRIRAGTRRAFLLDVCDSGAGAADQGTDRSYIFCWRGYTLSDCYRPVAPLEGAETGHWLAALFGYRRALAHSLRPGQSRPRQRRRKPPHHRQRTWLFLLLLHQRALPALL